jgi:hypothetical protein
MWIFREPDFSRQSGAAEAARWSNSSDRKRLFIFNGMQISGSKKASIEGS